MTNRYILGQYLQGLRAITAQESVPEKIAERVAPLAKKFAPAPGWLRPAHRRSGGEQDFEVASAA